MFKFTNESIGTRYSVLGTIRLSIIFALCFALIPQFAYSDSNSELRNAVPIGDVVQVAENVYAGSGTTGHGEPIYFGMELVDSTNIKHWDNYGDCADLLGYVMAKLAWNAKRWDPYTSIDEDFKKLITQQEYDAYSNYIHKIGSDKESHLCRNLYSIGGGYAGFDILNDGNTYVVYVSKKPVNGKFKFAAVSECTLKAFNENYDDILMTVRSKMKERLDTYNNRGIVRNPISFIKNDYSGISMQLHGFSAAVARKFLNREYMTVEALREMYKIIKKELKPGDTVGDQSKFSGCFSGDENSAETRLVIRTEALSRFYLEKKGNPPLNSTAIDRFRDQFVHVPPGRLPDETQIVAMEADKYPVTRELWREIMPEHEGIPEAVPADERANWNQSPRTPVTYVNWENEDGSRAEVQVFLERLNQREAASGCTYDLPTDKELWYLIRGDVTGENQDLYSSGVTARNVNVFVTHLLNSGHQIQPVGNKQTNAFGIELGNVWKMSKDISDPTNPYKGRSVRGGSWSNHVSNSVSDMRYLAIAGYRSYDMGFALVRRCFLKISKFQYYH